MTRLADLYRGASLSPTLSGQTGSLGSVYARQRSVKRAKLLADLASKGIIKESDIGPTDQTILQTSGFGPSLTDIDKQVHNRTGPIGDISQFLSNTFGNNEGRGLAGVAKNFFPGVFELVKAVPQDVSTIFPGGKKSVLAGGHSDLGEIAKNIGESYAYTYGGKGAPKGSTFWSRFKEAPLGPILDAATLFSGGATGAGRIGTQIATRAAPESALAAYGQKLAGITSRQGRRPVVVGLGDEALPIQRDYSSSPLRKYGIQKPLDALVQDLPHNMGGTKLRDFAERRWQVKSADLRYNNLVADTYQKVSDMIASTASAFRPLTPKKQMATMLAMRGFNEARYLDGLEEMVQRSLRGENPEIGQNIADYLDVPIEYVKSLAHIDPEVRRLIDNPEPDMVLAASTFTKASETMAERLGIDPDIHRARIASPQQAVLGEDSNLSGRIRELKVEQMVLQRAARAHPGDGAVRSKLNQVNELIRQTTTKEATVPHPDYPIRPTYVPDMSIEGMKYKTAHKFRFNQDKVLVENSRREARIMGPTPYNVFGPPNKAYLKTADMTTLKAGAIRNDPKMLVEHLAQQQRDIARELFNEETINEVAARGPDGKPAPFKTTQEMWRAVGSKDKYVLVYTDPITRWVTTEHNVLAEAADMIDKAEKAGKLSEDWSGITRQINSMMQEHASEFVNSTIGAVKAEGYAIPVEFYNRVVQHMKVYDPLPRGLEAYSHIQNKWRSLVLSLSPRWWINTAVGSAMLAFFKGTWNPRDYYQAYKLISSGKVPGRIRQQGMIGVEALEPGKRALLEGSVTTKLAKWNNEIEQYFRTAVSVQQIRIEHRQQMAEIGESIKNVPIPFSKDETTYLAELMDNPNLVNPVVDEINRFSYNYGILNPNERRYVRLAVPFYGWYKFITKLMWRLPVNYPGRANILSNLGQVGYDMLQDDLKGTDPSSLPPWLQGIIGVHLKHGELTYHTTFGLNPFAQFGNPFADEGPVQGMLPLSSANPLIQATLKAEGIDPLNPGEAMEFHPGENYTYNKVGRLIDLRTGNKVPIGNVAPFRRFLGSLMLSVPQTQLADLVMTGGQPTFPEHVPFFAPRPIPVAPGDRKGTSYLDLLLKYAGLDTKHYNLRTSQDFNEEMRKQAVNAARAARKQARRRSGR